MTIDEANTALAIASNRESRIAALKALKLAASKEIERLLPGAPDWSCNACYMTWAGGTTPPNLLCPACGSMLTEDPK